MRYLARLTAMITLSLTMGAACSLLNSEQNEPTEGECSLAEMRREICTIEGEIPTDEDCDGQIDERCGECVDGETRRCENECSVGGLQRCNGGVFTPCDAPRVGGEICEGQSDEDCDGVVDEGCPECVDGVAEPCESLCGVGRRMCQSGILTSCDAPQPALERCDGEIDEDCDGEIDEECDGEVDEGCVDGEMRGCESVCGAGVRLCQGGVFTSCDAPQPTSERCDGEIDEDCDGEIDEDCSECVDGETRLCGNLCGIGVERCQENVFQECDARVPEIESCDGRDNDCDGIIDEESCPVCELVESRCDGLDDDCNGIIDDEKVCGTLIYQHCEVRLGWWYDQESVIEREVPLPPWPQWPPLSGEDAYCPAEDEVDEALYSCDVAKGGTGFQMVTLDEMSDFQSHWLGIDWRCEATGELSLMEQQTVEWAQERCHIALGLDYWSANRLRDVEPRNCRESSSLDNQIFRDTCIQTQPANGYSAMKIRAQSSIGEHFALAFYCDTEGAPQGFESERLAERIQEEFQVFFVLNQRGRLNEEDEFIFGDLPARDIDNSGRTRGVGTTDDGSFNVFRVQEELEDGNEFGVYSQVRSEL